MLFSEFVTSTDGIERWQLVLANATAGRWKPASARVWGGRRTPEERRAVAAVRTECYTGYLAVDAEEIVAEVDVSFAEHGNHNGGNQWRLIGGFVAWEIEKLLWRRR